MVLEVSSVVKFLEVRLAVAVPRGLAWAVSCYGRRGQFSCYGPKVRLAVIRPRGLARVLIPEVR
jgi:hypothetical protein